MDYSIGRAAGTAASAASGTPLVLGAERVLVALVLVVFRYGRVRRAGLPKAELGADAGHGDLPWVIAVTLRKPTALGGPGVSPDISSSCVDLTPGVSRGRVRRRPSICFDRRFASPLNTIPDLHNGIPCALTCPCAHIVCLQAAQMNGPPRRVAGRSAQRMGGRVQR